MPTARSTPNIALIKYWGNRNNDWRLPAADSLSMTLNEPFVDVTVDRSDSFTVSSSNKELNEKDIVRFQKTIDNINTYLASQGDIAPIGTGFAIKIHSYIPPSIGLASSSAVFSALAVALSTFIDGEIDDKLISVMARLGSGSAARSIYGGFTAITNDADSDAIDSAYAQQIADEDHWKLHDIIIVPSRDEKKVGSTEGHANAHTSAKFADRIADMPRRQQEAIDAIKNKDFEKLQAVAELDCMDMHECMQTQTPELHYLNEDTYRIVEEIKHIRSVDHLPVLYTMDAGPTVHLFCTDESKDEVLAFAKSQGGCEIFESTVGTAAHLTE